jgi:hypothetical protein
LKIRIHQALVLVCAVMLGCAPMPIHSGHPVRTAVGFAPQKPESPMLRRLENGHYRVKRPWTVTLNGRQWKVQKGYTCNGMTVPDSLKKTMGDGVDHPETWAAVFHDWLFTQPGISRGEADQLFHDILIAYGVPAQKANLMYTAVRAYSLTKGLR